jgi:hypothetical protein
VNAGKTARFGNSEVDEDAQLSGELFEDGDDAAGNLSGEDDGFRFETGDTPFTKRPMAIYGVEGEARRRRDREDDFESSSEEHGRSPPASQRLRKTPLLSVTRSPRDQKSESEDSDYIQQSVTKGKRGHRQANRSAEQSPATSESEAETLELLEEETLEDVKKNLATIMDKYKLGTRKCPPDVAAHADGVAETVVQLSATCGLGSSDWQSSKLRTRGMVKVR